MQDFTTSGQINGTILVFCTAILLIYPVSPHQSCISYNILHKNCSWTENSHFPLSRSGFFMLVEGGSAAFQKPHIDFSAPGGIRL